MIIFISIVDTSKDILNVAMYNHKLYYELSVL